MQFITQRITIGALLCSLVVAEPTFKAFGADLPPDVLLVAHAIQANKILLNRLTQYTCLETIARTQPTRGRRKAQKQDVIQLDVGLDAHQEIYSWPGEKSFSSNDLVQLVGHGLLSNGIFRAFAYNLFVANAGVIRATGEGVVNGTKAHHFTFSQPSLADTWQINWRGAQGTVGEEGEFWVDPIDLTLLQLDVTAIHIPWNLPLESIKISIQYRTLPASTGHVLIPETAVLNVLTRDRESHQETITFSHCRAFEAESQLTVGDSPATPNLADQVNRYEAQREVLPEGLVFSIELATPLQKENTKIGDRISAVLVNTVKVPGRDSIPKGAILNGRVRQFRAVEDAPNTYQVGLEFDELTWPGHNAAFFGSVQSFQSLGGVKAELSTRSEGSKFSNPSITTYETVTAIPIPGVASFFVQDAAGSVLKGFRMTWRTESMAHR